MLTTRSMPPKASTAASIAACTASGVGDVGRCPTALSSLPISAAAAAWPSGVEVGDHDVGALAGEPVPRWPCRSPRRRRSPPRSASPDGLGLRHPLQLGFFECPVLDLELLGLVDRPCTSRALGTTDHVDRVDVELSGHPSGLGVLAVARTCRRPGTKDDQRIGGPEVGRTRRSRAGRSRPGSRPGTPRAVHGAGRSSLRRRASAGRSSTSGLTLVRRKWFGQDVPSAASRGCLVAARKSRPAYGVRVVTDHRPCPWEAIDRRLGRARRPSSAVRPRAGAVAVEARAERLRLGVLGPQRWRCGRLMIHSEFRSSLPGRAPGRDAGTPGPARPPAGSAPESRRCPIPTGLGLLPPTAPPRRRTLAAQDLAVCSRRDRDAGIGVEMIDVGGVDQPVHRGVDRLGPAPPLRTGRVERRDRSLVLALHAGVDVDQGPASCSSRRTAQPLLLQSAEIATGALDPQQFDRLLR